MAKGQIMVAVTGDSTSLDRAFDKAGASARDMAGDFDKAGGDVKKFGSRMDDVGGTLDASESKFMGTADLLDGLATTMGLPIDGAIGMARGFGDLAGGLTSVVVPAVKAVLTKLGLMTAATAGQAAATEGAAVAQGSLNLALLANPIGIVIASLLALGAIFIVAWKNSETFRDIVRGAFKVVHDSVMAVVDLVKRIPGILADAFSTVAEIITAPYRAAFKAIKSLWNSTVGGFGFEFGGWDPPGPGSIPGIKFKIPEMASGGMVTKPTVALIGEAGPEAVVPLSRMGGMGGGVTIVVQGNVLDGRQLADMVQSALLRKQRSGPLGFTAS